MFHTTVALCMNIVFIQIIDANFLSIVLTLGGCLTLSSITKFCADCKVYFLFYFLDLSSITIIDWEMDFVVSIASLYNSSFKVLIFLEDSANFLKTNVMSPLNLCFLFPTTLLETPNKFVAHV